jgi:hypothetical protein
VYFSVLVADMQVTSALRASELPARGASTRGHHNDVYRATRTFPFQTVHDRSLVLTVVCTSRSFDVVSSEQLTIFALHRSIRFVSLDVHHSSFTSSAASSKAAVRQSWHHH